MKRIFYHGTTADVLKKALKEGLVPGEETENKNWDCSLNEVYLWDPIRVKERDGIEEEEDAHKECFRFAAEQAEFSLGDAKNCRRVVLAIELDDADVIDDESVENMEGAAAFPGTITPDKIVGAWQDEDDLSLLKLYFLSMRKGRDLAVNYNMPKNLERMVDCLGDKMACEASEFMSDRQWDMKKARGRFELPINNVPKSFIRGTEI